MHMWTKDQQRYNGKDMLYDGNDTSEASTEVYRE